MCIRDRCFHTNVDAVAIGKKQQPGIAFVIVLTDAEPLSIAEIVVLLLFQYDFTEHIQPCGILDVYKRQSSH